MSINTNCILLFTVTWTFFLMENFGSNPGTYPWNSVPEDTCSLMAKTEWPETPQGDHHFGLRNIRFVFNFCNFNVFLLLHYAGQSLNVKDKDCIVFCSVKGPAHHYSFVGTKGCIQYIFTFFNIKVEFYYTCIIYQSVMTLYALFSPKVLLLETRVYLPFMYGLGFQNQMQSRCCQCQGCVGGQGTYMLL